MDDDSLQYNDMEYDGEERNDSQEEDYTQTQSTQQASQSQSQGTDAHLWGYLQPCSSALTRIDFWKIHPRYTVGRAAELNQVVLPGAKVSEYRSRMRSFESLKHPALTLLAQATSTASSFGTARRRGTQSSPSMTTRAMAPL